MPRILLIEDNPLHRELTVDLLKLSGYEAISANSGEEAVRLALEHKPDLILLDLSLPGMDGLEVVRELKADPALASIPVVAVTAHAMKSDEQRARKVGCSGYISKPIDTRDFLATIESYLRDL